MEMAAVALTWFTVLAVVWAGLIYVLGEKVFRVPIPALPEGASTEDRKARSFRVDFREQKRETYSEYGIFMLALGALWVGGFAGVVLADVTWAAVVCVMTAFLLGRLAVATWGIQLAVSRRLEDMRAASVGASGGVGESVIHNVLTPRPEGVE